MPTRRCLHFAYLTACHKDRERYPFKLRDTTAAWFLGTALAKHGYQFADVIINYPSSGEDLVPFDESFLRETDLILLTTRPPMDRIGDKKDIARSFTTLEEKLFRDPLGKQFGRCARSEILLTAASAGISAEIAKRQSMIFRQHRGAMYQSYGSPVTGEWRRFKSPPPLTAAFVLYTEHAWPGGPALLAAFGMGGTETLVWCSQLATRFPHLLCTTPFAMAEMRRGTPAEPPTTMSLADSWEVTILGAAEPTPAHGPQRAA